VDVQLGRGPLPRPVQAQHDPQRVHVVGAVLRVVAHQRAEDAGDQDPGLGRGARQQHGGLVAVTHYPAALSLCRAERPAGLLGGLGQPVGRPEAVARAQRARLSPGRDQQACVGRVRDHDVQRVITLQQQVRDAGPGQPAVQLGPGAVGAAAGGGEHAGGRVETVLGQLGLGDPGIDPAVQEPGQQVRAEPALPLLPGGELRQLESAAHGDVLQHDRAGQLVADRLDDQRGRVIAGYGHRHGADHAGRGIGQAQPQHAGNRVAVRGVAGGQGRRVHGLLVVVEQRQAGRRVHQVQPDAQLVTQPPERLRARPPGRYRGPQQLVQAGHAPQLPALLAVVGIGHGADDRRERHAERHGQQRQGQLVRAAGGPVGQRWAARAQPEREAARAGLGHPLDEMNLGRLAAVQPGAVGQQQLADAVPFPGVGQVRGVHPADLAVGARPARDQRHLQVREPHQLTDSYRHSCPPAIDTPV
jgi:hypothetical protein